MVYQVTALKLLRSDDVTGCPGVHGQLHIVGHCISEAILSTKHGQAVMLGQLTSQEMLPPQM